MKKIDNSVLRMTGIWSVLVTGFVALAVGVIPTTAQARLLGHWTFDETSGNALDSSGNGFTGTITGAVRVPGPAGFGSALSFDSSHYNDYVEIPNSAASALSLAGTNYTIAFWVKSTASLPNGNAGRIISMGNGISAEGYSVYYVGAPGYSNGLLTVNHLSGVTDTRYITEPIGQGGWDHFAMVYDAHATPTHGVLYFYKNGVYIDAIYADAPLNPVVSGTNLFFGKLPGYGQYFQGCLDDVRIYDEALDSTAIQGLMVPENHLLAHWTFDEASGDALDSSGHGFTGTVNWAVRVPGPAGFGSALSFDSSHYNDYVEIPNSAASALSLAGTNYTIAFWVKSTASLPNGNAGRIISMGNGISAEGYSVYYVGAPGYSNGLLTVNHLSGVTDTRYITEPIGQGVWDHFAMVYDAHATPIHGVLYFYKNGVYIDAIYADAPLNPVVSGTNLFFGKLPGYGQYFQGCLDDVRIYDIPLDSTAIQGLMVPDLTVLSFNPAGGLNVQNVVITCVTSDAVIRYTTDGNDPTTASSLYTSPILVDHNMTLKALAWVNNMPGTIKSAAYTVSTEAPKFNGGSYISAPKPISISCDTPGAVIYYTTNGADPTTASPVYAGAVTVDDGMTLKAIAKAPDFELSTITSVTYAIPSAYDTPATIPAGSATVDGNLSDWVGADWTAMTVNYDGAATDVTDAAFAVRWNADRVYVAVKVRDTAHKFADVYTDWNARDGVEVYLHTTGNGSNDFPFCETAQQYTFGFNAAGTGVWAALGNGSMYPAYLPTMFVIPADADYCTAGGRIDSDWLYYEVSIKPFDLLGVVKGKSSVVSPLALGDVVGFDVVVVGNNGSTYTGMKSANEKRGKSGSFAQFGLHTLAAAPAAKTAGDANGDGKVDVSDLGILAANYGATAGATWAMGDFNGDMKVDVSDLGILAANYGTGTGATLDFNKDAKALGLVAGDDQAVSKDDAPVTSTSGCGSAGLPLIAGLVLMGLFLIKLDE